MVLVKNWPFFHLFCLGNIGQENVFYDILERKNAFLGYKNKKFKIRKVEKKGLVFLSTRSRNINSGFIVNF